MLLLFVENEMSCSDDSLEAKQFCSKLMILQLPNSILDFKVMTSFQFPI